MAVIKTVIKGKNLEVSPAIRSYAEKKVAKFERYLNDNQEASMEVMLRLERDQQIAELTLNLSGLFLRGEGKTSDLYASVDEAVDRIERQFSKFKTKIQRRLQGPKISEVAPTSTLPALEEEKEPRIVKTKRFAVKPMGVEEAVMQMELLGHDFFVFANATTDEVNVIYKRKDSNYGLIEPEF